MNKIKAYSKLSPFNAVIASKQSMPEGDSSDLKQ
jgi:hypothetical protein